MKHARGLEWQKFLCPVFVFFFCLKSAPPAHYASEHSYSSLPNRRPWSKKNYFVQNRYGRFLLDCGRKIVLGKTGKWLFIRTWSEFFSFNFQSFWVYILCKCWVLVFWDIFLLNKMCFAQVLGTLFSPTVGYFIMVTKLFLGEKSLWSSIRIWSQIFNS